MQSEQSKGCRALIGKGTLSLWLALAFAAGLLYFFESKGIQFYLVPSASMEPTLMESDYIGGFDVKAEELRHGDIVVFTSGKEGDFYVKRIVGLPGDSIAIVRGLVYLNGHSLDEPYIAYRGWENIEPLKIPDNRVFIMGDNRTNSVDSRELGPVPTGLIEAKISFIYSPLNRVGGVE